MLEHEAESLGLPVAEGLLWATQWDVGRWEIPIWKLQMVPFDNSRNACWGSNKSVEGQVGVMLKRLLETLVRKRKTWLQSVTRLPV